MMCFIHSLTAKSNTHGRAKPDEQWFLTLDGFPASAPGSVMLGSDALIYPPSWPFLIRAACRKFGPNNWGSAFLPAVFQGTAFNADKPILTCAARRDQRKGRLAMRDFKLLNERNANNPGDTIYLPARAVMSSRPKMQL